MTQTNPSAPAAENSASDRDPLLHLHKMSTTAGVGSQEYVAVNVTAVVAVLFGLASLLAIASPVLLVFPIVGVCLSWVALTQIRHSNGTQTGGGLAILGLIFSGIITAVIFSYQGLQVWHRRADEQAIAALCQKYGELLDQKSFAEAYALFDADFQSRVGKQAFINQLTLLQVQGSMIPPIEAIWWNGLAEFHSTDEGNDTADAVMKVRFRGSDVEGRMMAHFRRINGGQWQIDNIPDQFPAERPTAPAR